MITDKGASSAVIRREHDLLKEAKRTILVDPFGGLITQGNFSVRIDEVDANTTYIGTAQIGTNENEARWQIKKIVKNDTTTSILWARGTDEFINKWSERLEINYS